MRTTILTMVYCNARVFAAGMKSLADTVDLSKVDHVLLDQHYPLRADETAAALHRYCWEEATHKPVLMDKGRNLGLHGGLNHMIEQLGDLADDDVVVGFDPDEHPLRAGWLDAMLRVFAAEPKCGWLSLMSPPAEEYMKRHGARDELVGGERVRIPGYSLINTVCAWSGRALKAMGKLEEPHPYYGGLEGAMMPKLMGLGFWIGWMVDYPVAPHHDLADDEYQRYKRHHVGFELPQFHGSFAEWLERKR